MTMQRQFTIVGAATTASRLSGFLRDVLMAAVLGTGAIADAFVAAYLIPNLFRRMASEGAFNAALVPRFARLEAEGGHEAVRTYAKRFAGLLISALLLLLLAAEIGMAGVMRSLVGGFRDEPDKLAQTVLFARILFPFVAFVLLAAFLAALLNTVERYVAASLAPLALNIGLIAALVFAIVHAGLNQHTIGLLLVFTVAAAGLAQLVILIMATRQAGLLVPLSPRLPARDGSDRDIAGLMVRLLPAMFIAGAGHVHVVIASQFASVEPRAISWLYYADRLFQLPLGFVAASVGVVLLPRFARRLSAGEEGEARAAQHEAMVFALLLILPATLGLFLLAEPIVVVLFQRGAFTAIDTRETARIVAILALALPGFVLVKVLLPTFLAREALRVPLLAAALSLLANVIAVIALKEGWNIAEPAAGVAVGAWSNALLLALAARGRLRLPGAIWRRIAAASAAPLVMAVAIVVIAGAAAPWLQAEQSLIVKGATLALVCIAGLAVHLLAAFAFGAVDRAQFSRVTSG